MTQIIEAYNRALLSLIN